MRPSSPTKTPFMKPMSAWKLSRVLTPVVVLTPVPMPVTRELPTTPLKACALGLLWFHHAARSLRLNSCLDDYRHVIYSSDSVNESETTGSLVWRLAMHWRAAVDRAVAPFGLTHAQYVVLASLHTLTLRGARPSQRELADYTALEPVYISRLAKALEEGGLIERAQAATDTRAVELSLTREGEDRVIQAIVAVRELHDSLLASIGGPHGERTRRFRATLRALLRERD